MNTRSLVAYFVVLILLCAGFVVGARMLGQQGVYLSGAYMLTPALAAIVTRVFFYKPHFKDARIRLGRWQDYVRFWLYSLAITAFSFALYSLFGAISWDLSGKVFLDLLAQLFALAGQDINASLPPGMTMQTMLWLYVVGGLTVFNIVPGILTGFGEEFGHRGFMNALLFPSRPWLGLLLGGVIWYLWHLPLLLVVPPAAPVPLWQAVVEQLGAVIGAICTHVYLCYVYSRSGSILVPSVAHISLNNAARSLSYFAVLRSQFAANLAQDLVFVIVVLSLYLSRELSLLTRSRSENVAVPAVNPPSLIA